MDTMCSDMSAPPKSGGPRSPRPFFRLADDAEVSSWVLVPADSHLATMAPHGRFPPWTRPRPPQSCRRRSLPTRPQSRRRRSASPRTSPTQSTTTAHALTTSPRDRVLRFSIGEAFRALPLEAHFASMRSRVCVAIAHRHAPDHFDVVLAVAAMLFAVLRQCAARASLHPCLRFQQCGCGHRELDSPLSQCSAERIFKYNIESA